MTNGAKLGQRNDLKISRRHLLSCRTERWRPSGQLRTALAAFLALLTGVCGLGVGNSHGETVQTTKPKFVGAETCKSCHQAAYADWQLSHHSWALREPTQDNVLGNFDDATFEHSGVRSRFFKRDGKFFVETDGPDGKPQTFEVAYAVGVAPLQQYLVELDSGRFQALDLAWDVEGQRWFHLYPSQTPSANDGLHWTGVYKNWNARCAVCHSTDYRKNYSPREARYESSWSDINVACEACHGPGEAHVAWAEKAGQESGHRFEGVDDKGLTFDFDPQAPRKEIEVCATCHSRRQALTPDSPVIGAPFDEHHRLALLRPGLYHADGQIQDEVYVYGSFLQSKMYDKGVRCTNCHEPHSGELRAEGNAVCTQCHNAVRREDFPTINLQDYDSEAHHFHEVGSEGAQCVSCHMPTRNYMVGDPRRDHSFRVPRPDLRAERGTPNSCNQCHKDQSPNWAAGEIKKRYPNGRMGRPHFAELFSKARKVGGGRHNPALLDLALDQDQPAIVRASALDLLRGHPTPQVIEKLPTFEKDASPLVRAAAARLGDGAPQQIRANIAKRFLGDPSRSVRLAAIPQMLDGRAQGLSESELKQIASVMQEHQHALLASVDFPETQMSIAGLALVMRNLPVAEQALKSAVSMDPQLADAWLLLARIQMQQRRSKEARETLRAAIAKAGGSPVLYQSLGNVLANLGEVQAAERALKEGLTLAPDNNDLRMDLAALYTRAQQPDEAEQLLKQILDQVPDQPQVLELLALNQLARGSISEARDTVKRLTSRHPGHRLNRRLTPLKQLP